MNIITARAVCSSNKPEYTFFSELNNICYNFTFLSNIVNGKLFLKEQLFMLLFYFEINSKVTNFEI